MPKAAEGIEKLDLLVVADPHPTTWAVLGERKDSTYLLPICTQFECDGSRTASNRSLQWGEQIVKPIFESKNDYEVMYLLAQEARLRRPDVQEHQGRERPCRSAEDILREINRGGWSTGYCGQSPERLKAHMKQPGQVRPGDAARAEGRPGDRRRLLRPALAVLGHAGAQASRHATRSTTPTCTSRTAAARSARASASSAREAAGRHDPQGQPAGRRLLLARTRRSRTAIPSSPMGVLKKLGWDKDLTAAERATIERIGGNNPDAVSWSTDLSGGIQRVAHGARLHPLRQRQGARHCVEPAGSDPGASRADLHAAARSRREVSDAARREAVPRAEYRLHGAEGGGRQGHRQAVPAHPHLRPPGRIRRRRRGDALQQVARRAAAGHVHRDQSGGRRRARHQGRRLGLGHGPGEASAQGAA